MLSDIRAKYQQMVESLGKSTLTALFPNDFEYYLIALELTNSDDETIDYFVFPVFPSQIRESDTPITKIKKTLDGVVSLSVDSFIPRDITISGNFGKKLRFLLGKGSNLFSFSALNFSSQNGINDVINSGLNIIKNLPFDATVKTGYGCVKLLQSIIRRSNSVDTKGQPFKLYLYNMALGENYLVKAISLETSQSYEENMIWKYSLNLKAIAPIIKDNESSIFDLIKLLAIGAVQNKIHINRTSISNFVNKIYTTASNANLSNVVKTSSKVISKVIDFSKIRRF